MHRFIKIMFNGHHSGMTSTRLSPIKLTNFIPHSDRLPRHRPVSNRDLRNGPSKKWSVISTTWNASSPTGYYASHGEMPRPCLVLSRRITYEWHGLMVIQLMTSSQNLNICGVQTSSQFNI